MAPCIIYAAKSTEDKHESIPDQLRECREMAAEHGWTVVAEFSDEGFTAYKGDRGPGLESAMSRATEAAAVTDEPCMLLAQAHDRFARGAGDAPRAPRHLVEVWIAMRRANVHLRTVEDDYDMRDVQSVAAIGQRAMMDSRRKSRSVKKGMKRRAAKGLNSGRRPLGYRFPGNGEAIVPVEAEVAIVHRIDAEFLAGSPMTTIARRLMADGVPTVTGSPWRQSTVSGVLRNPLYVGLVRYDGELVEGQHEPIRDRETHDRIQALLRGRPSKGRGRPPAGRHLFRGGLLRCECGEAMVPRTNGGYEMYYCNGRHAFGKEHCTTPHLRRAVIDEAVFNYFTLVALDVDATSREFAQASGRKLAEISALLAEAQRESQRAEERVARIERDYTDGKLDVDEWRRFRDKLTPERDAALAEVSRLASQTEGVERSAAALDAETEVLRRLAEIRKSIAGDVQDADGAEAVRAALASLFDAFVLHRSPPARVQVELMRPGMWIEPILRADAIERHTPSDWPLPRRRSIPMTQAFTKAPKGGEQTTYRQTDAARRRARVRPPRRGRGARRRLAHRRQRLPQQRRAGAPVRRPSRPEMGRAARHVTAPPGHRAGPRPGERVRLARRARACIPLRAAVFVGAVALRVRA